MHQMGFVNWLVRAAHKKGANIILIQWFPEEARAMALQDAEILLYPAAIGSEPQDQGLDSRDHWKRVMQGHAVANLVPVVASNRIGKEIIQTEHGNSGITFMKLLYSRTSKGNCCSS
ncbi:N-carbamoylputrescine amidase [Populus trichocarpa]|uniref:CN hydrolase domain-containing protein n=2 Tax=Populus trichocarpa TaxID=3694 RepID=A0A3N7FJF0_POPTR|nr:N-carbamoylputrescine amidase [Populus trichocarpa]|eukprot:XP_024464894.1 N-carbamoylputrescine amidase [Populus trichocarpa]